MGHNEDVISGEHWNNPPEDDHICEVDFDSAYFHGVEVEGGADGVYFMAEEFDGKWYASAVVDTDSNHNCGDEILTDDGPHDSYLDACFYALAAAHEFLAEFGCDLVELDKSHDALAQAIPLDSSMSE